MILVDSSGWIEYLAALPKADLFAPYIEGKEPLVSSAIQIYEIYEVVRRDVSEERAVAAVSALRTTTIEPAAVHRVPHPRDTGREQATPDRVPIVKRSYW